MTNIYFILTLMPLVVGLFKEFPTLQKNYKHSAIKGYVVLTGLPVLFTLLSFEALKSRFLESTHFAVVIVITASISYILSSLYYKHRLELSKMDFGNERWFMSRFYRDTLYSLLVATPALVSLLSSHTS